MSKNKECVIYDEWAYYGKVYEDGNENGVYGDYLSYKEDLTELDLNAVDYEQYLDWMKNEDYSESLDALKHYFAGEKSIVSDYINPLGMNEIAVRGTIQRWNGKSSGFKLYKDLDDLLYGRDSVFKDCVIDKIWDDDGHLFISGYHHDGSVEIEVKQLTDAGIDALNDWEPASIYEDFHPAGKIYPVGAFRESLFLHDFWDNSDFCEMPHYAKKVFGYKQHDEPAPLEI